MRFFFPVMLLFNLFYLTALSQSEYYSISPYHLSIIEKALNFAYNEKYSSADSLIDKLEKEIPDYPGLYLLKAYYFNLRHGPLDENTDIFLKFKSITDSTLYLSEQILMDNPDSYEAHFFTLSIHAMMARTYVDTRHNWKAIMEVKKAYRYIVDVMEYVDEFPELNLYCGIYNYYREKYPEENPSVKPFIWILKGGDKSLGLSMLKNGSDLGIFTKPECLSYLYFIIMRYENQPQTAIEYSRQLHELYPYNHLFSALLAENLIFIQHYGESKQLIDSIVSSKNPYHRYMGTVYLGLYYELHEKNFLRAERVYHDALLIGEQNNLTTPHCQSLCYLGLGRIYLAVGETSKSSTYLKLAEKISEYGFVRDEAKKILQEL